MKKGKTKRGFALGKFKDSYKEDCSIQQSSVGEHIWLGISDIKINIGYPWVEIGAKEIQEKFGGTKIVGTTRMHLSKRQVKKLLPLLIKFAETGELY